MPDIEGVYTPRPASQLIVKDDYDLTVRRGPHYTLLQLESMYARIVRKADNIPLHKNVQKGNLMPPPCYPAQTGVRHT